mgnify:CR=1 FL=1
MPIVKSRISDRVRKYTIKYPDAETMTARLNAVKEIMDLRYQAGSSVIYNAVEATRNILETKGVPTGLHGAYYAFAQEIVQESFSHSGATLNTVISGLKQKYVTAHNLDPTILDEIVKVVIGVLPPY